MNSNSHIRDLLKVPVDQVWNVFNGSIKWYNVEYEDGVVVKTHYKRLIMDRHTSVIFEHYPKCQITSKLCITSVLNGEYYNATTGRELDSLIFKAVCEAYNFKTFESKRPLLVLITTIFDAVYNDVIQRLTAFATTIDANDFVGVVTDPRIMEIHANMQPTPVSIEQTYKKISEVLKTSTDHDNMFIHAYRAKSINENQANQVIGPIGLVTDIERTVYKVPIMNGFIRGLGNIYELAAGSRSAAKALNANDNQIKVSEYISRRFQLLSMAVTNVVHGDCGSTIHTDFLVQRGDLDLLKGKHYLLEDGVSYGTITGNEKHFEGGMIKFRSILSCTLHNPHEVCSTCFGAMAGNFPVNSNIGHLLSAHLMEKVTSSLLATKHLTSSVRDSKIYLGSPTSDFLHVAESDKLFLNSSIDKAQLTILISPSELPKLRDVIGLPHTNISTTKLGELSTIAIVYNKGKRPVTTVLVVDYQDRQAVITYEFLCYIKRIKLETDSKGNYMINMTHWNMNNPIFMIPLKEDSPIRFANKIASVVETDYEKITSPSLKYDMLYSLVNSKLKINTVILELLIYASSVYDRDKGDYTLGRNSPNPKTAKQMQIFGGRSMSQLYVFEGQLRELFENNGRAFLTKNRSGHPMDIAFDPNGVLARKK